MSAPARLARAVGHGAATVTLAGLAVLGVVVVGWLIFSKTTGATLVVFQTGSMAPNLPEGAAAIALPTPADELQVGDVVTVQRAPGTLPVTHRVIDVAPAENPDARTLVLKGDANHAPDLKPHVATEALRVVAGGPGWGEALATVRSPLAIAALTGVVAALCLWAFWPKKEQ